MFFDFGTETTRIIPPVGAPAVWHKAGLSLSPDGTDLIITHTEHAESAIRLVTPFR